MDERVRPTCKKVPHASDSHFSSLAKGRFASARGGFALDQAGKMATLEFVPSSPEEKTSIFFFRG
jgi:hypothetical protein